MPDVLQAIIDRIVQTVEPDRIVLFGSRGQGAADSDYDILVLKRGVTHRRRVAQAIYLELTDIPAPVDVIVEDPEILPVSFTVKPSKDAWSMSGEAWRAWIGRAESNLARTAVGLRRNHPVPQSLGTRWRRRVQTDPGTC